MASQNEASISVSSAPMAARNTPRSRCSSALQECTSHFWATACASSTASGASALRFAANRASAQKTWQAQRWAGCPIVFYPSFDPRNAFSRLARNATDPTAEYRPYRSPVMTTSRRRHLDFSGPSLLGIGWQSAAVGHGRARRHLSRKGKGRRLSFHPGAAANSRS